MIFNSIQFLLFFPIVIIVYYVLGKGKMVSSIWLLLANYYFYMCVKPVYGILLFALTAVTYACGLLIEKSCEPERHRKLILTIGLVLTFAGLLFFKYYNFFASNIGTLFTTIGFNYQPTFLKLFLPIGISFFTFQAAGYLIDVFRGTVKAETNFVIYAIFVSFFPVILAGPIQRASILIPQLRERGQVRYDDVMPGIKMMIWGFFMKLCVADRLATYVDAVYSNYAIHNGTTLAIAAIFYSIQIYGDFAGYSLTAIGCARVMGFKLPDNFKRPYFATSIQDFWRRWHIALSTWFRDYLYIPLGGNRVKYWRYLLNIMIVFLISGLWHGAGWTFIIWGGLHGSVQVIESIINKGKKSEKNYILTYRLFKIVLTFILATIVWIFFRAETIGMAGTIVAKIFSNPGVPFISPEAMLYGMASLFILLAKDISDEFIPHLKLLNSNNRVISDITCSFLIIFIILFGVLDGSQFIYFQF